MNTASLEQQIQILKKENETLSNKIQSQDNEILMLKDIGDIIASEFDLKKLYQMVADRALKLLDTEKVLVPILNHDATEYTYIAGCGTNTEEIDEIVGESMPIEYGVCGWVFEHRRAWWRGILHELEEDERNRWEREASTLILVPLIGKRNFLGGLACFDKKSGEDFDERDFNILTLFANQVSVALDNAILFNDLNNVIRDLDIKVQERTSELEKARESAEEANKAKSIFLASMSHEIRTPMNAVLGYAQLMKGDPDLTEKQNKSLCVIENSGRSLAWFDQ